MPPALYYRARTGNVETISLNGLPLGIDLTGEAPYSRQAFNAEPGDVMVLMTDGLLELFDCHDEMFGSERAGHVLQQHATDPSDEVIQTLVRAGFDWADGRAPEDDVTIVVIKFEGRIEHGHAVSA